VGEGEGQGGGERMTTVVAAIAVLGPLIFFHEFGHFIAAKRCGMKVLTFSLGYGKKLIGLKRGDTQYIIPYFPLIGGYVKIAGESYLDPDVLEPYSYLRKPVWQRMIVVASGPVANIVLASILFSIVYFLSGLPVVKTRKVGKVEKGSIAESAGILPGDEILYVDGRRVKKWDDIGRELARPGSGPVRWLTVRRDGRTFKLRIEWRRGLGMGIQPLISPIIGGVMKEGPAWKAGLRKGDLVLSIDGIPVRSWDDFTSLVRSKPGKLVLLRVRRGSEEMTMPVKVAEVQILDGDRIRNIGQIGVTMATDVERYRVFRSLWYGVRDTANWTRLTLKVLWMMMTGKVSLKYVAGPLGIIQYAGRHARVGVMELIMFIAVISVNLGILNLLPIPILDGGHLMFYTVEAIRRRPISMKRQEQIQKFGFVFLLTIFVLVFYNDISRIIKGMGR
jgi:regulator of sigma E protease